MMATDKNLFPFASTQKELEQFLNAYHADKTMIPPYEAMRGFKDSRLRICRFCNSPAGTKMFKKAAHVIPEFLGNRFLYSDFECDDCNARFSRYEAEFAAWLGLARSVMGTVGKKGVPTFKSANQHLTARLGDFLNIKATKISTPNSDTGAIKFDAQTGKTKITYTKEPYIPIRVYKSLLKMALSMVAPDDVEQYRGAFNFLLSDTANHWYDEFARVMFHMLPMEHRFTKPVGLLYKKNDPMLKLPMHGFTLYYETYIFAMPLPFNKLDWDHGLYSDLQMDFLFPPAVVFHQPHSQSRHFSKNLNLSGYQKVTGEQGVLSFEMKPEDLGNLKSFDPKTVISKPGMIDANEIVAVILAPEGTTIKQTVFTITRFELP